MNTTAIEQLNVGDIAPQKTQWETSFSSPTGALPSFGSIVSEGLESINGQLIQSQRDLQKVALGEVENLHQIMIRLEETKMNFQLFMQVRNRALEAYQDIMKMSV